MTAREIQMEYLQRVKSRLGEPYMPTWSEELCNEWESILKRLSGAPHSVERTLDWAIKLAIFRDHFERNGLLWNEVPMLSGIRIELESALNEKDLPNKPVSLDVVLAPDGPMRLYQGVVRLPDVAFIRWGRLPVPGEYPSEPIGGWSGRTSNLLPTWGPATTVASATGRWARSSPASVA